MSRLLRRPITWVVVSVVVIGAAIGLYLFQPWKLFTHSRIDEAAPVAAAPAAPAPATPGATTTASPQPRNEVLAQGQFVTQEHPTSGTVQLIRLADGSRVLRLENFTTSDGPDVHVWLSDAPAGGPDGGYDDGRYVKLGKMKATEGNQNYPIPADAKLDGLRSAVIWCDRFNVAFGSAPLTLSADFSGLK
jgi:hypothetical protein